MALILSIETATETCSVALANDAKVLAFCEATEAKIHATELNNFIAKVLSDGRKTFADIDAVAVSKGPGSYTGLRIGVASAKGICYALDKPLLSVNTLLAMTYYFRQQNLIEDKRQHFFIPMIDARRDEVYCAVFNSEMEFVTNTEAKILEGNSFDYLPENATCHFFGSGAMKAEMLLNSDSRFHFYQGTFASALGLVISASEQFTKGQFESTAYFEPYYLKEFMSKQPLRQR